jgi:hypothetical protein
VVVGRSALRDGEGAEDPAKGANQDHQLHSRLPYEPAREGESVPPFPVHLRQLLCFNVL